MKGLRLLFTDIGVFYNFGELVEDFESVMQDSLVNIGTQEGSNLVFTEQGTPIEKQARKAVNIVSVGSAFNVGNAAALKTKQFIKKHQELAEEHGLSELVIYPYAYEVGKLKFTVAAVSTQNESIGLTTELQ